VRETETACAERGGHVPCSPAAVGRAGADNELGWAAALTSIAPVPVGASTHVLQLPSGCTVHARPPLRRHALHAWGHLYRNRSRLAAIYRPRPARRDTSHVRSACLRPSVPPQLLCATVPLSIRTAAIVTQPVYNARGSFRSK
jgi:hypothetical protein